MELIEKIGWFGVHPNRKLRALFRCPRCSEFVERDYYRGKAALDCRCGMHDRAKKTKLESGLMHGKSNTTLFRRWSDIKTRLYNPRCECFKSYGGRGIKMCEAWRSDFLAFESWALKSGFHPSLTIERKDVNGDYCPENCEWIPQIAQGRNKRTTKITEEMAKKVAALHKDGVRARDIIKTTGISKGNVNAILNNGNWSSVTGLAPRSGVRKMRVFDILNAGPRHRFTVRGPDHKPMIASNCVQATARECLGEKLLQLELEHNIPPCLHVHDEIVALVREKEAEEKFATMKRVMSEAPSFMEGLPLAAEGSITDRYGK